MLLLQRRFSHTFYQINETHVAGEPMSAFQLGERRRKRTTIDRLEIGDNNVLDSSADIEQHVFDYFRQLYAEEELVASEDFACSRAVPAQSPANLSSMDDITTEDIFLAIKSSAKNKSPGCDGIPLEFYAKTFDVIHRHLNLILNEVLRGNIPREFVEGVVVLVKKKGAGSTIKAYRPISLLNTDYKLFSRILKTRLDRTMREHQILTGSQKCSNSDKNIFQATLSLKDRIAQLKERRGVGKMVSFDLDHAFDRVDRGFLKRTMESLGFNPMMIGLLDRIGQQSSSRVLVNGHLSQSFPIQRSVRQGDPLSMHLFVIYLHPLIQHLEQICSGPDDLVIAYADDVTIITTCPEKIERVRGVFGNFERIAGARLNLQKTTSIDVGHVNNNNRLVMPWLQTVDKVKVLGIVFVNSVRLMVKLNWEPLVGAFARQLWLHRWRTLTLQQKVVLLNTFITSKLWYVSSVIPITNAQTARITSLMGSFLWAGQICRVPIQQLALPIEKGGLKLHLPIFKCKALLVNRHTIESDSLPFYRSILNHMQNPPNLQIIPPNCPCLRALCSEQPYLPANLQENPSAKLLHLHYTARVDLPKVMRENPGVGWKRIWRNIASKKLSSNERNWYYLLVNHKLPHQDLLYRMQRASSTVCPNCNNAPEDLQHKISTCARVTPAWAAVQHRLRNIAPNRNITFNQLVQPTLLTVRNSEKFKILKTFIQYVIFISRDNNAIDINELIFHLETEV